jgi:hypothetical protein
MWLADGLLLYTAELRTGGLALLTLLVCREAGLA